MTQKYRTKSFVFKKEDKSESDRVFTVFTEDFGKLEIFAKAIRKIDAKLKGGIDTFYLSEIEFIQGKNYKTLTDATLLGKISYGGLALEKSEALHKISNVMDIFIKGQEKDGIFFNELVLLLNHFYQKNIYKKNYKLLYHYFFWNFLSTQGYHLQSNKCAVCQSKLDPDNLYFSAREGGTLCEDCLTKDQSAEKVNSDVVKVLRIIFKKDCNMLLRIKVDNCSQNILDRISENALNTFSPDNY